MVLSRWLRLSVFPEDVQSISFIFSRISALRSLAENLLIITLILYFLDTLDDISVGVVWSVYFLILAVVDYPTGILGDHIGYRKLLTIAYLLKIIAVLFLIFGSGITYYVIFMVFFALGDSQESGALESWYDNHYKEKMDGLDDNRELYTAFTARKSGLIYTMAIIGFTAGGFITNSTSPQLLFSIYLVLEIIIWLFIIKMPITPRIEKITIKGYFQTLYLSLKVFFSNKVIFFYLLGTAILWTANESIWFTFQLYRLYREYTGSDQGTGILRSLVFLSGLLWSLLIIPVIKFFKNERLWVFVSSFLSNTVFFVLVIWYYTSIPPNGFRLTLVIGFLLIYQIPASWEALEGILRQKITIDLIPNNVRNSLYSMLPTISRLMGGIFVFLTGVIIHKWGFVMSLWWVAGVSLVGSLMLGLGLLVNHPEESTS